MLGIAVIALLPSDMLLYRRLLIGWDAGIALYLVLVYYLMARARSQRSAPTLRTRTRAGLRCWC